MAQPVIRQDNQVQRWPHPDIRTGELFGQLERLRDDVRRLLGGLGWSEPSGAVFADGLPTPLADVEETDDAYVVEVELPGVGKDDVVVSVDGHRLSVDAERRDRPRTGVLRRRTRAVGHLHYEVVVPGDIDEDGATASLNDGVLTVRLAKPAAGRVRRIPVG